MLNSLRFRLALICVGLAIGPLILVAAIIGIHSFTSLEQQSLILQREVATSVGSEIKATIEGWEHELVILDEVHGFGVLDLEEQRAIMNNMLLAQRGYQEMVLLNAEGQEQIRLSRSAVYLDDDLKSRAGNEEFLFTATGGGTYFSPVRFDNTIREPLVTISVPLFDRRSGEIVSVLLADLRFKMIWDLLAGIELPREGDVYVIDQAGEVVVAHRNPTTVLRGTTVDLPEADGRAEGLSGTDVIIARDILQFGNQELVVVAEQPISDALALATDSLRVAVIITFVALVIAVILGFLTTRRIVRPIEALATSARAISGGDFSQRVEVSSQDEVGQLAGSFNKMTEDLVRTTTSIDNLNKEITERKRAEAERESLLKELERINRRLEESNRELQDFVYIASHDLREPLRKITSFGTLLQGSLGGKLDEDQQENFKFMIDGSKRMQTMIDDLLTYSRVTTKAKPFQQVNLNNVIEDLKNLELATLLDETKGTIHVPEMLPPVYGDSSQIHQLLQNLVANGLKFHRQGVPPEITIRARRIENNMVRAEVQDNGIGIAKEYYEQVFTMFKRLHSRTQYKGTGIGLAACKKIVQRHGGEIGIKSTPGEGSIFWFTLPRGSYSGND